jgi:hypothetical protein
MSETESNSLTREKREPERNGEGKTYEAWKRRLLAQHPTAIIESYRDSSGVRHGRATYDYRTILGEWSSS